MSGLFDVRPGAVPVREHARRLVEGVAAAPVVVLAEVPAAITASDEYLEVHLGVCWQPQLPRRQPHHHQRRCLVQEARSLHSAYNLSDWEHSETRPTTAVQIHSGWTETRWCRRKP